MFEAVELGHEISKQEYCAQVPKLRTELLQAQLKLRQTNIPVIIVVSGAEAAGKGEVVHRLTEWLDPRGVETHAFWETSDEELERPGYWRFWRTLPARGRIGIFFGSWYSEPIVQRVHGDIKAAQFDAAMERVASFEKMLADDGALIIKLWYHLSKKAQRKRLEKLESDPKTAGRVSATDWKNYKLYDKFIEVSERAVRHTDTASAPWQLIDAADRRYRELTTGQIILKALQRRLAEPGPASAAPKPVIVAKSSRRHQQTVLDRVNLRQKLSDDEYDDQLAKYQGKLTTLTWEAARKKVACVAAFEGWDAAGKGSAIRRVTAAIDPRLCRVVSIAAPTDEERAHHYLWRFWRHLPRAGHTTIFDRSWYGRVLVERVEGFIPEDVWSRAYFEINEFEEQLVESGMVLVKFWIHISKAEQLRRFEERQNVPFKQYKITEEDWRNRGKWERYEQAINDMVTRTSTEFAPWTLVAGNDKKFARVQILKTLCANFEKAL